MTQPRLTVAAIAATRSHAAIRGEVVRANQAPVAGARVCAYCANCAVSSSTSSECVSTEADGSFSLARIPEAEYRLFSEAPGLVQRASVAVRALAGQPAVARVIVEDSAGAPLQGRVLDALGVPIAGARLRCLDGQGGLVSQQLSDAQGDFVAWLATGRYQLLVSANGYASDVLSIVAPSRDTTVKLMPASSISGRVLRARDQRPVAGVSVRAIPSGQLSAEIGPAAVSDEHGDFTLDQLLPGRYNLRGQAPGFRTELQDTIALGVAERVLDIVLPVTEAGQVRGRVLMRPEGKPCTRGYVVLTPRENGERSAAKSQRPLTAQLEANGEVLFEGVPFGRHVVGIRCSDHLAEGAQASVELSSTELPVQHWWVEPAPSISVEVTDGSGRLHPRSGVTIRALSGGPTIVPSGSEHGRVIARALKPGTYVVASSAQLMATPSAEPSVQVTLTQGSGATVVRLVRADLGSARLQVTRPDGTPYNQLTVEATLSTQARRATLGQNTADGIYELESLTAGDYRIAIADGSNPALTRMLTVHAGSATELQLEYGYSGTIRGRVVDANGEPVAGAWVAPVPTERGFLGHDPRRAAFATTVISHSDGRFELTNLDPTHKHTLSALTTTEGRAHQRNIVAGSSVELVLAPTPPALTQSSPTNATLAR